MILPRIDKCPNCGHGLVVRSAEQNARFHALLQDISQQLQWAGEYRDAETWKRMLVASFERASNHAPMILPALDGQGIDMVYRRTHRLSKQEMSGLIEFATAWAIDKGVRLPALEVA